MRGWHDVLYVKVSLTKIGLSVRMVHHARKFKRKEKLSRTLALFPPFTDRSTRVKSVPTVLWYSGYPRDIII
jgi:hypothetical protein